MQRQLEPELMLDPVQAQAYAQADFSTPHGEFIRRLQQLIPQDFQGHALDLGCGTGDISRRFASAFPASRLDAVDGSAAMLAHAQAADRPANAAPIRYLLGHLPAFRLPENQYDLIFSNSLLHHLPDPMILWQTVRRYSRPGSLVFIMDLLRPASEAEAAALVQTYASGEPAILQHDFYHSLLAAFTSAEITAQLTEAQLNFNVEAISDRHVLIVPSVCAR